MNWGGKLLQPLEIYQAEWRKWLSAKQASDPAYAKVPDTIPENAWGWGEHTPAFTQFLADVETAFCREMRAFLRDEIKTAVPITNLSSWWNPCRSPKDRTVSMTLLQLPRGLTVYSGKMSG